MLDVNGRAIAPTVYFMYACADLGLEIVISFGASAGSQSKTLTQKLVDIINTGRILP
jgi:hypothetical protein